MLLKHLDFIIGHNKDNNASHKCKVGVSSICKRTHQITGKCVACKIAVWGLHSAALPHPNPPTTNRKWIIITHSHVVYIPRSPSENVINSWQRKGKLLCHHYQLSMQCTLILILVVILLTTAKEKGSESGNHM